ncbi:aldo/keto reductase [Kangiella sp. HZ709]|nr:aldo/keto reductase [Kangiella sp. HZ709]
MAPLAFSNTKSKKDLAAGAVLGKGNILTNKIPSSGQSIPLIGFGTSRNISLDLTPENITKCTALIETFFKLGGTMIDSSPMYGTSEQMIGHCLKNLDYPKELFSTTKVWTRGKQEGIEQMRQSMKLWGIKKFDLMQIHNLVDWQLHLDTLRNWQEEGIVKHIGITTSHGRSHAELEKILATVPLDFVQLTYNVKDRAVENRLLPLALDRGIAVIVNRPFNGLFGYSKNQELPEYMQELGCKSWAQFYLKFVISHPAVTCAIPATSKAKHLKDNMLAGYGELPDKKTRQLMVESFKKLI